MMLHLHRHLRRRVMIGHVRPQIHRHDAEVRRVENPIASDESRIRTSGVRFPRWTQTRSRQGLSSEARYVGR